jgi:hypothetical protein
MDIIHCGFVPHQNKNINQRLISKRNNPADDLLAPVRFARVTTKS